MTIRKITTDAIESGSITESLLHINVSNKVNAAYATANTANSAGSGGYDQANAAYGQANTARSDANTTFATINTTFGTVNTNYQAAYAQANTARDTANNAYNNSNTKLSTSGGSISGDLAITGNLTVQGNATTINVTNLSVNDSMILLSTNAVGDSNDIGFIGHFDRNATATHAGLIRKATQNQFYLFDNYEVEPTNNVIDVAGNNFRVGNLRLGIINANSFVTAAGMDVTGQANAAYGQANAAYGQANAARSDANTTFATVNTTFATVNTTFATINTTTATMNTATSNRVLKAGDTMTGTLNLAGSTGGANVFQMGVSGQEQFRFETGISGITNAALLIRQDNNFNYLTLRANSVGIGTTNPSFKLHTVGSIAADGGGSESQVFVLNSNNSSYVFNSTSGFGFYDSTNARFYGYYDRSANSWYFHTSSSTRLTIDSTGIVGIGTVNPILDSYSSSKSSYRLNIYYAAPTGGTLDDVVRITSKYNAPSGASANVGSGPAIVFAGGIGDNQTRDRARIAAVYEGSNLSGLAFHVQDTADIITEKVRIRNNGNVGIGTTSPNAALNVWKAEANYILDLTNSTESGFALRTYNHGSSNVSNVVFTQGLYYSTTENATIKYFRGGGGSDGFLTFNTGGSERMRILTGGNVGINTTSPGNKLDVWGDDGGNGGIRLVTKTSGTSSYQTIALIRNTGSTVNDGWFQLYDNGTARINMAANAARGGDAYFNTGGALIVNGTGTVNGATLTAIRTDLSSSLSVGYFGTGSQGLFIKNDSSDSKYMQFYSSGNTTGGYRFYVGNTLAFQLDTGAGATFYGSGAFASSVMSYKTTQGSANSDYLSDLDGYGGSSYDGYYAVNRPGYSSFVMQFNVAGSVGTVQFAGSYNAAMYRRNKTDNNVWSSWRQVD